MPKSRRNFACNDVDNDTYDCRQNIVLMGQRQGNESFPNVARIDVDSNPHKKDKTQNQQNKNPLKNFFHVTLLLKLYD